MKKLEALNILIILKRKFIENLIPQDMTNYDGISFTRESPLGIKRLVTLIQKCSPKSLQIKLDDFFKEIGHKEEVVSKQAFSKARTKLDPSVLRQSFDITTEVLSSCEDLELYNNKYRLCAIDGSVLTLDNNVELLAFFGGSGKQSDCVSATASLCYDPLNDTILDGGLHPYSHSERDAAIQHFDYVEKLPLPTGVQNLYLFDRGYGSKELMAMMIDNQQNFLIRVRDKFNLAVDEATNGDRVSFTNGDKAYEIRVFKIKLSSGETEILVTNLSAEDINAKKIGYLYFKRWKVETKFNSLKNKLELENWSGRRVITTFQDFWAKLDLANTMAALRFATDAEIETNSKGKTNKYAQTTNENRLINKFSQEYINILASNDLEHQLTLFDELVKDIAKRPIEVKPNHSFERKKPRKKKFSDRCPSVLA